MLSFRHQPALKGHIFTQSVKERFLSTYYFSVSGFTHAISPILTLKEEYFSPGYPFYSVLVSLKDEAKLAQLISNDARERIEWPNIFDFISFIHAWMHIVSN